MSVKHNNSNILSVRQFLSDVRKGKRNMPAGFSTSDINTCCCIHDSIVTAGYGTTVSKSVADFFSKYNFTVVETGSGWKIF